MNEIDDDAAPDATEVRHGQPCPYCGTPVHIPLHRRSIPVTHKVIKVLRCFPRYRRELDELMVFDPNVNPDESVVIAGKCKRCGNELTFVV